MLLPHHFMAEPEPSLPNTYSNMQLPRQRSNTHNSNNSPINSN